MRMDFRFCNAPAIFRRALDIILSAVRWHRCLVYLDDVILLSASDEQHVEDVESIIKLLPKSGVIIKINKCAFFNKKVD